MANCVYNISLDSTNYMYEKFEIDEQAGKWIKIQTGYDSDYKGSFNVTKPPPTKNKFTLNVIKLVLSQHLF